eukprot:m.268052 g.268052  ORF g.268052 m.268052 type:complete len:141 (-) comp76379_c0_seq1:230-652(-)
MAFRDAAVVVIGISLALVVFAVAFLIFVILRRRRQETLGHDHRDRGQFYEGHEKKFVTETDAPVSPTSTEVSLWLNNSRISEHPQVGGHITNAAFSVFDARPILPPHLKMETKSSMVYENDITSTRATKSSLGMYPIAQE